MPRKSTNTAIKSSNLTIELNDNNKIINKLKYTSGYHPEIVERDGVEEVKKLRIGDPIKPNTEAYKLLTLYEFDHGMLMTFGFEEEYRALAIKLSHQFQKEFNCTQESQKAIAHIAAQSFIRTLHLNRRVNSVIDAESYNETKLKRLAILNKAYDQSIRQFHQSMQSLKLLHQSPIQITVKTNNANVANQQIIQETDVIKPK